MGTPRVFAAALLLLAAVACSGGQRQSSSLTPGDFTARVDHPLFSLVSPRLQVFEGSDHDPKTKETKKTRTEKRVLDKTETVDGVEVSVLEVREYQDDVLIETTLDYFAQHRDGSVWYFGERINDYEGGKVTGHGGQWLAGVKKAQP